MSLNVQKVCWATLCWEEGWATLCWEEGWASLFHSLVELAARKRMMMAPKTVRLDKVHVLRTPTDEVRMCAQLCAITHNCT